MLWVSMLVRKRLDLPHVLDVHFGYKAFGCLDIRERPIDTTKRLMSSPKCRSVEVINNPARPGSNHREVNCVNYK